MTKKVDFFKLKGRPALFYFCITIMLSTLLRITMSNICIFMLKFEHSMSSLPAPPSDNNKIATETAKRCAKCEEIPQNRKKKGEAPFRGTSPGYVIILHFHATCCQVLRHNNFFIILILTCRNGDCLLSFVLTAL